MNILITGANGYVGRNLCRFFADAGHIVVAGVRNISRAVEFSHSQVIPMVFELPGERPSPPVKLDAIIHTAARVPNRGGTVRDFFRDNVSATAALIEWGCAHAVENWIHLSSISVYGQPDVRIVTEATPSQALNSYGLSKLMAEKLFEDLPSRCRFVHLRLPGIVGQTSVGTWFDRLFDQLTNVDVIQVFNPDSQFNHAIRLESLMDFIEQRLMSTAPMRDYVNLAAGDPLTIEAVVRTMADSMERTIRVESNPTPTTPFIVSSAKAIEHFEYLPESVEKIIQEYVRIRTASR